MQEISKLGTAIIDNNSDNIQDSWRLQTIMRCTQNI